MHKNEIGKRLQHMRKLRNTYSNKSSNKKSITKKLKFVF